MNKKAIKINLYKKYDRALKQSIIDKEDLNSPKIKLISERVDKLVKYLDRYIIYDNKK